MNKYFVLLSILFLLVATTVDAKEFSLLSSPTTGNGSVTLDNDQLKSGNFGIVVETGGATVNITFTVYEDEEEVQTLTFTSTSAEKVKYWAGHGTSKVKISWVITNGAVKKVIVITTA